MDERISRDKLNDDTMTTFRGPPNDLRARCGGLNTPLCCPCFFSLSLFSFDFLLFPFLSVELHLQMILVASFRGRLGLTRFPEEEEPARRAEHEQNRNDDANDGTGGQAA